MATTRQRSRWNRVQLEKALDMLKELQELRDFKEVLRINPGHELMLVLTESDGAWVRNSCSSPRFVKLGRAMLDTAICSVVNELEAAGVEYPKRPKFD